MCLYVKKTYVALDNFAKQAFKGQKDYRFMKRIILIRRKMSSKNGVLRWAQIIAVGKAKSNEGVFAKHRI
jgi:hypothetical protein